MSRVFSRPLSPCFQSVSQNTHSLYSGPNRDPTHTSRGSGYPVFFLNLIIIITRRGRKVVSEDAIPKIHSRQTLLHSTSSAAPMLRLLLPKIRLPSLECHPHLCKSVEDQPFLSCSNVSPKRASL